MPPKWRLALQAAVPEYQRLLAEGAALSAVVKLGEVLAVAPEDEWSQAQAAVRDHVTAAAVERAVAEGRAARERALGVVSVGTDFAWEEIVLVLTIRTQLELASRVMRLVDAPADALDVAQLDRALKELAAAKVNRQAFASALATVQRNWGIPIADPWSS